MQRLLTRLLALSAVLFVFCPTKLQAQTCIDYSDHLHWEHLVSLGDGMTVSDFVVKDDHAFLATRPDYAGTSGGLAVVDVSDPSMAAVIARIETPGRALGIDIAGDYAYVADGTSGVQIVRIKHGSFPRLVSSMDTYEGVRDVLAQGNLLYVADGEAGVHVVDIKNPRKPRELTTIDTPGAARAIAYKGSHLFIGDTSAGTLIVDMSIVSSPEIVATLDDAKPTRISIVDDIAYIPVSIWVGPPQYFEKSLRLYDISDPVHPVLLSALPEMSANAVAVRDNLAYVASNSDVIVVDISDVALPEPVTKIRSRGSLGGGIALVDDMILTSCSAGLQVIKGIGTLPAELTWHSDMRHADLQAIVADGESLYTVAPGVLTRWGLSDPHAPHIEANRGFDGRSRSIAIARDRIFMADWSHGLRVFDRSNPYMTEVADIETPYGCWDVAVHGDYLYLGGRRDGLHVVRGFGEGALTGMTTIEFPSAGEVATEGDRGFVVVGSTPPQLVELDISDPALPQVVGSTPLAPETNCWGLVLDGDYAYLARNYTSEGGLVVVDISVPGSPIVVNETTISGGGAGDLTIYDGNIYVASMGFDVFDISDPRTPLKKGNLQHMYMYTNGIAVTNSGVYVANEYHGILHAPLQCASDPALTVAVDVKPGDEANAIRCEGNGVIPVAILSSADFDALSIDHASVTFGPGRAMEAHVNPHGPVRHESDVDGDGDIDLLLHFRIHDCDLPCNQATDVVLRGTTYDSQRVEGLASINARAVGKPEPSLRLAAHPNPFNPATQIQFELGVADHVELRIYSIAGRRVRTVINERLAAGPHKVTWNGTDDSARSVSSGVYFYQLRCGSLVETRRMVLVK